MSLSAPLMQAERCTAQHLEQSQWLIDAAAREDQREKAVHLVCSHDEAVFAAEIRESLAALARERDTCGVVEAGDGVDQRGLAGFRSPAKEGATW